MNTINKWATIMLALAIAIPALVLLPDSMPPKELGPVIALLIKGFLLPVIILGRIAEAVWFELYGVIIGVAILSAAVLALGRTIGKNSR